MATINVSNLAFYYDGSYDTIFKDVSLEIDTKWKLGFLGGNGAGKSSILRLLCGEISAESGAVQVGSGLIISYVPQDATFVAVN